MSYKNRVRKNASEGSNPSLSELELDKVFGKILSVIKIQSGNEIPDRINVNKIVFKLSLMGMRQAACRAPNPSPSLPKRARH